MQFMLNAWPFYVEPFPRPFCTDHSAQSILHGVFCTEQSAAHIIGIHVLVAEAGAFNILHPQIDFHAESSCRFTNLITFLLGLHFNVVFNPLSKF